MQSEGVSSPCASLAKKIGRIVDNFAGRYHFRMNSVLDNFEKFQDHRPKRMRPTTRRPSGHNIVGEAVI
jgi:hypothetical protein